MCTTAACLVPYCVIINALVSYAFYSVKTVEELQCLASWKEGSSRYLLGLIKYQHHASYEERFRCFVYEKIKKGLPVVGSVIGAGGERSNGVRGLHHSSQQHHHQMQQEERFMQQQPLQLQQHQLINHNILRNNHLMSSFNSTASASSPFSLLSSSSYPLVSPPAASSLIMDPNIMFRVSQSGDATCNGLSIMEGSRTMTFRRGK